VPVFPALPVAPRATVKLGARLVLAAALLLFLADGWGGVLVDAVAPSVGGIVSLFDSRFTVAGAEVVNQDGRSFLRVAADLAHPILLSGELVVPLWQNPMAAGPIQVDLTLGGLLQYPLLLLIFILAWPSDSRQEFAVRLMLALPAAALLLIVPAPVTVLAELRSFLRDLVPQSGFDPLVGLSRYLMGGGGVALALALSFAVLLGARAWTGNPEPRP
jgi:hypothetical protein